MCTCMQPNTIHIIVFMSMAHLIIDCFLIAVSKGLSVAVENVHFVALASNYVAVGGILLTRYRPA